MYRPGQPGIAAAALPRQARTQPATFGKAVLLGMFQARGAVSPSSPTGCTRDAQLLWLPQAKARLATPGALSLPPHQFPEEVLGSPVRTQP